MGPQQHERSAVGNSWRVRQELTRQQRGRRAGSRALFLHPRGALALPAACSRILNPLPTRNAESESLPHCSTRFCDLRCSSALRGVWVCWRGNCEKSPGYCLAPRSRSCPWLPRAGTARLRPSGPGSASVGWEMAL